jgi:hypothetical protein
MPQVHSVPQLCSVQQFSLDAQQDAFLLLLTAYNIPPVAMMANDANKMIFFMLNVFKFFVCDLQTIDGKSTPCNPAFHARRAQHPKLKLYAYSHAFQKAKSTNSKCFESQICKTRLRNKTGMG